jgi:hypothetical protein
MRFPWASAIGSLVLLVLLQTFVAAQDPAAQGYPGGPLNSAVCQLVRAQWGAGHRRIDVTQRVQSMIRGGQLSFKVNNANLGGDPAEGQKKSLSLSCQDWRGHNSTYHYREGDYVNMRVVGSDYYRGLRVLNATWGAGYRNWNVTDRVNGMVSGNRLSFKVNTTNLGGDPAQGQRKQLAISWGYAGRQRKHVWQEGDYVNLP